jgi:hypothetical protein
MTEFSAAVKRRLEDEAAYHKYGGGLLGGLMRDGLAQKCSGIVQALNLLVGG